MAEEHGVPAPNLTDAELERQGVRAHATRHWVFLHGTAEQFRTHTQRMLELEQEYLRRHPQRTWQGSGGGDGAVATTIAREARIRDLVHTLTTEVFSLLDATAGVAPGAGAVVDADAGKAKLLAARRRARWGSAQTGGPPDCSGRCAQCPARRLPLQQDPPLLRADGDMRVITDAGRSWLAEHPEE